MKFFKNVFFLVLVSLFVFISCTGSERKSYFELLPKPQNSDEILVYDRFNSSIFSYNSKNFYVVDKNDTLNYFQYEFNSIESDLYTAGHSSQNDFNIFQLKDNKLEVLLEMEPDTAIFPLVYNRDRPIFLKTYYDKNLGEKYDEREIVVFDMATRKLTPFNNTKGMQVNYGVYVKDILYFSAYNEQEDNFDIYSLDTSSFDSEPKLFLENLDSGRVYESEDELWLSDKEYIYNGEKRFKSASENYFYKDKLFQISITQAADLELSVTDIESEKKEVLYDGILGFNISNGNLVIYGHHGVKTVEVG